LRFRLTGVQLDQVAQVVDDPQAPARQPRWGMGIASGQRVGDGAAVVDLAGELATGVPGVQGAAAAGVPQGVGG
jgi:hypothetical protein